MKSRWNKVDWLVAKVKKIQPFKYCAASINRYMVTQDEKEPKYLSGKGKKVSR